MTKARKLRIQNFKTIIVQTSFSTSRENANKNIHKARRSNRPVLRQFLVNVENFNNEVESYEIEAYDMAQAAEIAQRRFGAEANNMNIYAVCE